MDCALAALQPLLMIPSLPPTEKTDEAPADASVASAGTNANVDTMDKDTEEEEESNAS